MVTADILRTCTKCGETISLDRFRGERRCVFRRGYVCKGCAAAMVRVWERKHPERALELNRRAGRAAAARVYQDLFLGASLGKTRCNAVKRGAVFREDVAPLVVLERDDGICGICGEDVDPFAFSIDHIVPCEDGGAHSYENIQLAHPGCNSRKSLKTKSRAPNGQLLKRAA